MKVSNFHRLFLGLVPSWRDRRLTFLGVEWSYECAILCKGYECFLEAGFQTLLHTYIQMKTNWYGWPFWRNLDKSYMIKEGKRLHLQFNLCVFWLLLLYQYSVLKLIF